MAVGGGDNCQCTISDAIDKQTSGKLASDYDVGKGSARPAIGSQVKKIAGCKNTEITAAYQICYEKKSRGGGCAKRRCKLEAVNWTRSSNTVV